MIQKPETRNQKPAAVRVRFAPSPTGSLHVGGARTALFNYLFAHGQTQRTGGDGRFLLRIEDTDRTRLVPGATEGIFDILAWFGLSWDEGPDVGGDYAPYTQSDRTDSYRAAADQLVAGGKAYRCFCTPERLQAVREALQARSLPPGYDRRCRSLPQAEIDANLAAGMPHVVRFAMPREGDTTVVDLIRGPMTFANVNLEDLVLLKSDGYPTYHLANVVDDSAMAITHILRGDEWISTAPVHVQLYQAFGWDVPTLAHMPLILAPGGGKLSKRHGATAMEQFREGGYLPEALINYLALLGWSLDGSTEIFSRADLLEHFTLERVSPSPATFDYAKLAWFNAHYINHVLSLDDLVQRVVPFLARAGLVEAGAADPEHPRHALVRDATALLKDRIKLLTDAPELMGYFLLDDLPPYDPALLIPKKVDPAQALANLELVTRELNEIGVADETAVETRLRAVAEEHGLKTGQLFMPIRVGATGRTESPGLFETLRVLGDGRVRRRMVHAVDLLRAHTATP